jgi:hypothetical protein
MKLNPKWEGNLKQKEFETADLYLASAISLILNKQPDFKVENGRTLFIFTISDDFYRAMNAYNAGFQLPAYEYAHMIKRLRAEMLMRRGMEGKR